MVSKEEKTKFSLLIEERSLKNSTKIMETIIDYCEEIGLEPEVAGSLINAQLKQKLEVEAVELSMVKSKKKSNKLQF